jgi:hypothetical protein
MTVLFCMCRLQDSVPDCSISGSGWTDPGLSQVRASCKWITNKGRERYPPPCPSPWTRQCNDMESDCPTPPLSPTVLASVKCKTFSKSSLPQTLLLSTTDRNCRPIWHKFQPKGGKEYKVHSTHTQYTLLAGSFWVLWQNLPLVAHNLEKACTTHYHSLI